MGIVYFRALLREQSRQKYQTMRTTVNKVDHLFRLLHFICRLCGLVTFSFKFNDEDEVQDVFLTAFDKILSVFWFLFYLLLVGLTFLIKKPKYVFWLSFWFNILNVSLANGIGAVNVLANLQNRKEILFIAKNLRVCDEALKKFNVHINHNYHLRFVLSHLTVSLMMTIVLTILTYHYSHTDKDIFDDILRITCYTSANVAISAVSYLYAFTLMGIAVRFRHLNESFR